MSELPIVAPGYEEPEAAAPEAESEDLSGCLMNTCVIDKAVLTETMKAAMRRPFFRFLFWTELVVMAAALGLLIWAVAAKQSTAAILQAAFLLVMAGFFFVQQFLLYPKRAVKNQLLRQAMDDGTTELVNRLWFTEDSVANLRGDSDELRHMEYKKVKRVTETRNLILLTTRRNRLISLDKKGFENGTAEDLYRILEEKCPKLQKRKKAAE